jgi:hypothetical protein
MKSRRILLILIPLVILVLIFSYLKKGPGGNSFADIAVTPAGSQVKVDGKGIKAGKIRVKAGTHNVYVSHDGFSIQSQDFVVGQNETRFVGFVLVSNSPETKDWYKTHPKDQQMSESIASRNFDQGSSDIKKRYPIVAELPFIDQLYRVDYGVSQKATNDPTAIALYVTYYSQKGRLQALQWLKFKGVDSNNTEVIYIRKTF